MKKGKSLYSFVIFLQGYYIETSSLFYCTIDLLPPESLSRLEILEKDVLCLLTKHFVDGPQEFFRSSDLKILYPRFTVSFLYA